MKFRPARDGAASSNQMKISKHLKFKSKAVEGGFGVVELLAAIVIITVALVFIMEVYSFFIKAGNQNEKRLQAVSLAEEAIEAVRSMRDQDWNSISSLSFNTAYYPDQSASPAKWILVSGQQNINGFTRQVILSRVYRDANDNIVESGGIEDPGTRKVMSTTSWQDRGDFNVELAAYLTNWR